MLLPIDLTLVFPVVLAMEALSSQCETQTRQPPAVSLPNGLRLDMKAQGSPEIWNANGETLYWGKRTANMLRNEPLSRLTTQERKLAICLQFPEGYTGPLWSASGIHVGRACVLRSRVDAFRVASWS